MTHQKRVLSGNSYDIATNEQWLSKIENHFDISHVLKKKSLMINSNAISSYCSFLLKKKSQMTATLSSVLL